MRRAPAVLTATAAGMAGVLAFHAHAPARTATVAVAATGTATSAATTSGSSSASSSGASANTVSGDAISTRYGIVQVRITVSGGKVTDVQALQLPQDDSRSAQISTYAAPQLRQSALSRQSASIDAVSGATYTSDGYAQSLQSALDQAGVA